MFDARTVEVGKAITFLTSQTVCDHLMGIWENQSESALWRAGRMTGWIEALTENAPETFESIPVVAEGTVFEECIKKREEEAWETSAPLMHRSHVLRGKRDADLRVQTGREPAAIRSH